MEDALKKQEALVKELTKSKKQKEKITSQARKFGKKRWELIDSIKVKNRGATALKVERDKLNAEVRGIKAKRDDANEKVRELVARYKELGGNSTGEDFKGLSKEVNRLEWKLQTSVLKIDKEDALVEKIKTLKKKLKPFKELIKLSDEIDEHKKVSRKAHEKILAASEESQKKHDKFVEIIEEIRNLEAQIEEINKKKEELSNKLGEIGIKEKLLETELRELEKASAKVQKVKGKELTLKRKESKEKARDVYEEFKRGKKLDLEDIYLLRKSGLV